jgi:hypothetical protein
MKYFVDTEYIFTTGTLGARIFPLSIGVAAEDGRDFYRVNHPALHDNRVIGSASSFVREHVIPVLFPMVCGVAAGTDKRSLSQIATDIKAFIGDDTPEFWGDYADFDYVVFSIIMGGFDNWPEGWPMHINDLQQIGAPDVPSVIPHNALADAIAVRDAYHKAVQR